MCLSTGQYTLKYLYIFPLSRICVCDNMFDSMFLLDNTVGPFKGLKVYLFSRQCICSLAVWCDFISTVQIAYSCESAFPPSYYWYLYTVFTCLIYMSKTTEWTQIKQCLWEGELSVFQNLMAKDSFLLLDEK